MPARPEIPTKLCAACGRVITWRKKWERDWDQVRYCSDACRRRKGDPDLGRVQEAMLVMLRERGPSASICPSEPARRVFPEDWTDRMELARTAARRLVAQGVADITQGGRVVDPSTARGPIRIRLTRR